MPDGLLVRMPEGSRSAPSSASAGFCKDKLRIPAFRLRVRLASSSAKVEQLCFFKFPRPLLERFGKAFFSDVPRGPGVYVFSGENELVAIPDSKVENVRVLPENEEQPILTPKLPKIWTRISENINSRTSDNSVHDS